MSKTKPYIVSLIPARSGSKGLPNKNILPINGIPLIGWTILTSLEVKEIDRTVVTTDSAEYARIAKSFGAEAPFIRPPEISTDTANDLDFVNHAMEHFQKEGLMPDLIVHLRPTTPIRNPEIVRRAIQTFLQREDITALRSVHEMSESAYKSFELDGNLILKGLFNQHTDVEKSNQARQTFPKTYSANGYVDILRVRYIQEHGQLHGNRVLGFCTAFSPEIDTHDDFDFVAYQFEKAKQD